MSGKLELQPHQVEAILRTVSNVNNHGILLNHHMGTGKTFSGLGILRNYIEKHDAIIVAPTGNDSWSRDADPYPSDFPIEYFNSKKITYLTFENLLSYAVENPHLSNGKIVIVDECHYLIELIYNKSVNRTQLTNLFNWLNQCFKLILLTGTPFWREATDIRYLINLAAGEQPNGQSLVPYNYQQFKDEYYITGGSQMKWVFNKTLSGILSGFVGGAAVAGVGQHLTGENITVTENMALYISSLTAILTGGVLGISPDTKMPWASILTGWMLKFIKSPAGFAAITTAILTPQFTNALSLVPQFEKNVKILTLFVLRRITAFSPESLLTSMPIEDIDFTPADIAIQEQIKLMKASGLKIRFLEADITNIIRNRFREKFASMQENLEKDSDNWKKRITQSYDKVFLKIENSQRDMESKADDLLKMDKSLSVVQSKIDRHYDQLQSEVREIPFSTIRSEIATRINDQKRIMTKIVNDKHNSEIDKITDLRNEISRDRDTILANIDNFRSALNQTHAFQNAAYEELRSFRDYAVRDIQDWKGVMVDEMSQVLQLSDAIVDGWINELSEIDRMTQRELSSTEYQQLKGMLTLLRMRIESSHPYKNWEALREKLKSLSKVKNLTSEQQEFIKKLLKAIDTVKVEDPRDKLTGVFRSLENTMDKKTSGYGAVVAKSFFQEIPDLKALVNGAKEHLKKLPAVTDQLGNIYRGTVNFIRQYRTTTNVMVQQLSSYESGMETIWESIASMALIVDAVGKIIESFWYIEFMLVFDLNYKFTHLFTGEHPIDWKLYHFRTVLIGEMREAFKVLKGFYTSAIHAIEENDPLSFAEAFFEFHKTILSHSQTFLRDYMITAGGAGSGFVKSATSLELSQKVINRRRSTLISVISVIVVPIIVWVTFGIVHSWADRKWQIKKFNAHRFAEKAQPFMYYYKMTEDCQRESLVKEVQLNQLEQKGYVASLFAGKNSLPFAISSNPKDPPRCFYSEHNVSYNSIQMGLWIKMTMRTLNAKELLGLGTVSTMKEATMFGEVLDLDTYLDKGRMIGNYIEIIGQEKGEAAFDKSGNKIQLTVGLTIIYPPKFKKILDQIHLSRVPAVVWSNFYQDGLLGFDQYITSHVSKDFTIYRYLPDNVETGKGMNDRERKQTLRHFEVDSIEGKPCILLLHPIYLTGLTIKGANALHIMDPLLIFPNKEQLMARVVRMGTHGELHTSRDLRNNETTLLPNDRKYVRFFQWYASNESIGGYFKTWIHSVKHWWKSQKHIWYGDRELQFKQDLSPDSIILKNEHDTVSNINNVVSKIAKMDQSNLDAIDVIDQLDCIPWIGGDRTQSLLQQYPDKKQCSI